MITQKQRDDYRYILEDKGVPEVIAFMAGQALTSPFDSYWYSAAELIDSGFYWEESPDGHYFWVAVAEECERTLK